MSNQTAVREDFRKDDAVVAYPVNNGVKIYKGALVGVDSSGYAKPAAPVDSRQLRRLLDAGGQQQRRAQVLRLRSAR